jgi:hypothetical protein
MTTRLVVLMALAILATCVPCSARAQSWNAEQLGVWSVIRGQWEASMQKDTTWTTRLLHSGFAGWDRENPAPRDRDSTGRWARYQMANSTTLMQELHPLAIIVEGNTAVAHYVYSVATENRSQERETVHGRYTDVLVREGGTWRFLAWHGGDDPGGGQ